MKIARRLRVRLRRAVVPPHSTRNLRYGVAVLSTILALIPAVVLPDVLESRLVVFAVAVMVSAWYGGWKPGLVATAFAIAADAYFALHGMRTEADWGRTVIHLVVFTLVALPICAFNAALRSTQEGLRRLTIIVCSSATPTPDYSSVQLGCTIRCAHLFICPEQ